MTATTKDFARRLAAYYVAVSLAPPRSVVDDVPVGVLKALVLVAVSAANCGDSRVDAALRGLELAMKREERRTHDDELH